MGPHTILFSGVRMLIKYCSITLSRTQNTKKTAMPCERQGNGT